MNKWAELLDIPLPDCKKDGQCCRYASPSTPGIELFKKAAQGDEFARDFLSIFIPYKDIDEAKKANPAIVERALNWVKTNKAENLSQENLVFYCCRYISEDNTCLIHEDRPDLCRNYPDSPFLLLAPGCAYQKWANQCKEKYKQINEDLKMYKTELENLRYYQKVSRTLYYLDKCSSNEYKFLFLFPSLSLVSPGKAWLWGN